MDGQPKTEITFHYRRAPQFRTIHADGAWGGLTPSGHISVALFSESHGAPDAVTHAILPNGQLGAELLEKRIGVDGPTRSLETEVIFTLHTAKGIVLWLQEQIAMAEQRFTPQSGNLATLRVFKNN
jgi:hypothetical protein